jgi:hypothetical protein
MLLTLTPFRRLLLLGLGTYSYNVYEECRILLLVKKLRVGTPEEKMQAVWGLKTTYFTAIDYITEGDGTHKQIYLRKMKELIDFLRDGTPAGEQDVQTLLRVSLAEYQVILKIAEAGKIAK